MATCWSAKPETHVRPPTTLMIHPSWQFSRKHCQIYDGMMMMMTMVLAKLVKIKYRQKMATHQIKIAAQSNNSGKLFLFTPDLVWRCPKKYTNPDLCFSRPGESVFGMFTLSVIKPRHISEPGQTSRGLSGMLSSRLLLLPSMYYCKRPKKQGKYVTLYSYWSEISHPRASIISIDILGLKCC